MTAEQGEGVVATSVCTGERPALWRTRIAERTGLSDFLTLHYFCQPIISGVATKNRPAP